MKNKNRVMQKLQSNSGASLLLALLFFIVCVVAGSIIIASATAASGRTSSLADSSNSQDQYTVDSASALVKKQCKDEEVYIQITGSKSANTMEGLEDASLSYSNWNIQIVTPNANNAYTIKNAGFTYFEQIIKNNLNSNLNAYSLEKYNTNSIFNQSLSDTPVLTISVSDNNGILIDDLSATVTPKLSVSHSLTSDVTSTLTLTITKNAVSTSMKANANVHVMSDTTHIASPQETESNQYTETITKVLKYSWTDFVVSK